MATDPVGNYGMTSFAIREVGKNLSPVGEERPCLTFETDDRRNGTGQAPRVGHLPALPGTGLSPRHLPEPGILTPIVTISTQELLREVGQVEAF